MRLGHRGNRVGRTGGIIIDHRGTLPARGGLSLPQVRERLTNGGLFFRLAKDEQETAAARPQQLSAGGSTVPREAIISLDDRIGDSARKTGLEHPALMKDLAQRRYISPFERAAKLPRQLDHAHDPLEFPAVTHVPALFGKDRAGRTVAPDIEKHQVALEVRSSLLRTFQRLHGDAAVFAEADVVQPAVGCRVLVLLADALPYAINLNPTGLVRKLGGRDAQGPEGVQCVEKTDRKGAARAHSGSRRDIGEAGDFHALFHAMKAEAFAHQRMGDLRDRVHVFGLGILDANLVVKIGMNGDVDKLIDRGAYHGPEMPAVKVRQIA